MRPPTTSLFPKPTFPASPPATSTTPTTRMHNLLDGGAPFYNVYTCADGRWMSVGCLEPQFFKTFLEGFIRALPADFVQQAEWVPTPETQYSRNHWPRMSAFFKNGFRLYDRDYWTTVFHDLDACAIPVLSPAEAAKQATASSSNQTSTTPTPHPQLSRTPARTEQMLSPTTFILSPGQHTDQILEEIGVTTTERRQLTADGAFGRIMEGMKTKL
ncbi:hypothetical protein EIP86_001499 [Pleurotus ostreatoroseus]|nr:hypothetical protein EIP86_001499 [Pleurotus ostreatoroseus]